MALVGGLTVALVGSAAVVAYGDGYPASRVALSGGGAWLASPTQGLVTLIDGASEQVVGSVRAPGAKRGDALSVVQYGASAYMVNEGQGTVSRVDGATYDVSEPIRFTDEGGGALGLFTGPKSLYVVDSKRRVASVTDPLSLQVRDRLSLVAQPGPEQSVVDATGRLWVLDREKGGLTWYDKGKRARPEVGAASARLVLVQGRPVLVDEAKSRLGALAPDGTVSDWSCLELRSGDRAQVLGSASSARVFAAIPATGTLVANAIDRDDCGMSVNVGKPGDDFGPLAEASGFVFVPNRTSGRALVVDVAAGRVAGDLPVTKPGARLELLAKDGFVFYNDLDGDTAGVIRLDGGEWRLGKGLHKFQPSDNGKGILTPAGDEAGKDPAIKPPTDPKTPPTKNPPDRTPPDPTPPTNAPPANPPGQNLPLDNPTVQPNSEPGTSVPLVPPIIRSITVDPATPVRGRPARFTADVADAESATWRWTLTRADGREVHRSSAADGFTFTPPVGELGAYEIRLEVTGPGGASAPATKGVPTTSSGAPQISDLFASETSVSPGEGVTFTATEHVAGENGVWTWDILDAGTNALIRGPFKQDAGLQFTTHFTEPGSFKVRVTVTFDGESDSETVTVQVVGDMSQCTMTTTSTEVDLRRRPHSAQVRITGVGCPGAATARITAPTWLNVPATMTIPAGGLATLSITQRTLPPEDGGTYPVTLTLDNGRTLPLDVLGNRPPALFDHPDGRQYTVCIGNPDGTVVFYANYDDAVSDEQTVVVRVGNTRIPLELVPGQVRIRGLYRAEVQRSSLPAGVSWTVTSTDKFGDTSVQSTFPNRSREDTGAVTQPLPTCW
ncbi:MAG TPA: PKD domain-containing protein [Micromonosporaceae bacterium]|nr:PKD domain-containing protein [Micromonosporaceae bacterium]